MEIPEYPAIAHFCRIMHDLPADDRGMLLYFVCGAMGKFGDRTGIKATLDTPIRHLNWDVELKDLYERMVYLVEEVRLVEEYVVLGAIAFTKAHLEAWADAENSERNKQGFLRAIESAQKDLALPIEQRLDRRSDKQIHDFIAIVEPSIQNAEARRQESENLLSRLNQEFAATFTLEFWDAFRELRIRRNRGPDELGQYEN